MIPCANGFLSRDFIIKEQPSNTYRMNLQNRNDGAKLRTNKETLAFLTNDGATTTAEVCALERSSVPMMERSSVPSLRDLEKPNIRGHIDKQDAMKQAIYKILNTERYQYAIYSWNYGVELLDLFGEPLSYVLPEIKRRVIEALTYDKRIVSVDNFSFEVTKGKVHTSFSAHTIFGDIPVEKAVGF